MCSFSATRIVDQFRNSEHCEIEPQSELCLHSSQLCGSSRWANCPKNFVFKNFSFRLYSSTWTHIIKFIETLNIELTLILCYVILHRCKDSRGFVFLQRDKAHSNFFNLHTKKGTISLTKFMVSSRGCRVRNMCTCVRCAYTVWTVNRERGMRVYEWIVFGRQLSRTAQITSAHTQWRQSKMNADSMDFGKSEQRAVRNHCAQWAQSRRMEVSAGICACVFSSLFLSLYSGLEQ